MLFGNNPHDPYSVLKQSKGMNSIHAGLRARELKKDHYERLHCVECDERTTKQLDPTTKESIIVCPSWGKQWRDL